MICVFSFQYTCQCYECSGFSTVRIGFELQRKINVRRQSAQLLLYWSLVRTQRNLQVALFALVAAANSARADLLRIEFDRSLDLFEAGDYSASSKVLRRLVQRRPDRALYWFNLGNSEYKEGHFDSAIKAWNKVIELKSPLALAAKLYIVRALIDSNRQEAAARNHSLIYRDTLPSGLKEEFNEQEVQLASYSTIGQSTHAETGGLNWNSLVNLSLGTRSATDYGTQVLPMGNGYIEYQSAQKLGGVYQFQWDDFIGTDRLLTQTALAKAETQAGKTRLTAFPGFSYEMLSASPFALKPLVNLQAERQLGMVWTGLLITGSRTLVTDPSFSYLTGNSLGGKLYGYIPVSTAWIGAAFYLSSQATGELPTSGTQLPYSNKSIGFELNATAPIAQKWTISGSTSFFHRSFDQSEAENIPPSDHTLAVNFTVSYRINSSFSANFSQSALWDRASSAVIFSSTQFNEYRSLAGISWSPFGNH
jgi:hypothetical protein